MLEEDLHVIMAGLKVTSPGCDMIRVCDLRRNYNLLCEALLHILNSIFRTGIIPRSLKRAIVRPVYKGGSKNSVESYRPISLLPTLTIIMEKYVQSIMSQFAEKNNIISTAQYGFMPGKGTQSLLEDFSDEVWNAFDHNCVVSCLLLDLSKAFDTVNHDLLLIKLFSYGFRGPLFAWLKNYFHNRSQVVKLCEEVSSPTDVKMGVPQGSVIAPLLFNLYVNDLYDVIRHCKLYQYADDTLLASVHAHHSQSLSMLQHDASAVYDWFTLNCIRLNASKTQLITFHNPLRSLVFGRSIKLHSSSCIDCACPNLSFVSSVKYLGIHFDSDMSWNTQVTTLCSKLRSVSCVLYHLRTVTPPFIRKLILESTAYSVLRYGITIYIHCGEIRLCRIDRIIKSCLRNVAYGNPSLSTVPNMFQLLRMPSIHNLFVYTAILKHYWSDRFKRTFHSNRELRNSHQSYVVPRTFTRYGTYCRNYYVPHLFNSLSSHLLCLESKAHLKKALKELYYN